MPNKILDGCQAKKIYHEPHELLVHILLFVMVRVVRG